MTFLALDAILGWPVKMYDGSWVEWGQMSDHYVATLADSNDVDDFDSTYTAGTLIKNSPWRTDCGKTGGGNDSSTSTACSTPVVSEAISYNNLAEEYHSVDGTGGPVPVSGSNSFALNANQVNEDDKAVCAGGGGGDTGGGGGGGY